MPSRNVVLTGASSGIGRALAEQLASAGFDLVLVGRDERRLAETVDLARARAGGGGTVTPIVADLSTLAGARALADRLLRAAPRIDVLVHNAGILPTARKLTADGFEESFATNHLAPFLLNRALRPRLVESAPARIVQVSAGLYIKGRVDLENGPYGAPFGAFTTYASSKLWNLLAGMELARELSGTGVTVNAVHPGVVRTRLGDMSGLKGALLGLVKRFWATPEDGARGPFHLATSPDLAGVTGCYFDRMRAVDLHPVAREPSLGRRVVERTLALVDGA
jgi:NAD(P)-dependent dehydrogenase (short-subunit alcohol dehydrogenase family)